MPSFTDRDEGASSPPGGAGAAQAGSSQIVGIGDLRRVAALGRRAMGGEETSEPARRAVFEDLFVLELANNHWGSLERGLAILDAFAAVVRANGVRAAIKLQFRDVDTFIHKDFRANSDIRYVKKVSDTHMSWDDLGRLVAAVRRAGMITMSTPFDEISVRKCAELDVEILKIASSDIRDRTLVPAIAEVGRPTIVSTGGSSLADIDAVVGLFRERRVPLAINHCVSIYPSEDDELDLNQIDFLVERYPDNVIGFSTHEFRDWSTSVAIAYAKGARTFERHIDLDRDGIPVSPYCSLPHQADEWFRAFNRARRMCGASGRAKRVPPDKEVRYLDALVRGVYAKRPLAAGEVLSHDNVYLAIPLLQGQMSCRELTGRDVVLQGTGADDAVMFEQVSPGAAAEPAPLILARGHRR